MLTVCGGLATGSRSGRVIPSFLELILLSEAG